MVTERNSVIQADAAPLEEALVNRIKSHITAGNYPATAAWACGIDPKKLWEFCNRGEIEQTGPYYDLYCAVNQSVALNEVDLVSTVKEAADGGDWKASAWLLERRHSQWSPKSQTKSAVKDDTPTPESVQERLQNPTVRQALADTISAMAEANREAHELATTDEA